MEVALIAAFLSGGILVGLLILLRRERTRGVRYAARYREGLDRALAHAGERLDALYPRISEHTVRQTAHYALHSFLAGLLAIIQRMERAVRLFLSINKRRANVSAKGAADPHFSALAQHKEAARLSDEEQQKRREEALEGQ